MTAKRNVLFIMCDQLQFDHRGGYGHPFIHTPNIDRLAYAFSEYDSPVRPCAPCAGSAGAGARLIMVTDGRLKAVCWEGFGDEAGPGSGAG